jgi:hypothetical protein
VGLNKLDGVFEDFTHRIVIFYSFHGVA